MTDGSVAARRPTDTPTQPAARRGFFAFCLVVAIVNVFFLGRVTGGSSSDADTYLVAGLHSGAALLYAWVWVTAVLVWTSRENLWSMLDDAWPRRDTTKVPSSGLRPWVRAAVYLGALLVSTGVVVAMGDLPVTDAPDVLGVVVLGHGFALLMGAIAAGLLSYPVLLVARAVQLGRGGPKHLERGAGPRTSEQDVRRARQGMLSLGVLLLLVLPVAVCLTLAYESTESGFDVRPLFGVVPDSITVLSPALLWTGRLLLLAIVLLLVRYLTTLDAVRHALRGTASARSRAAETTETSLFEVKDAER